MITAREFKEDVLAWAKEVGVEPREVHVRRMKRKWASCSSRGRLTFDLSLLGEGTETRAGAILHELLHLKFPNHGKMFNSLLNAYLAKAGNGSRKR
jgi:predicted metal-dependent hydrolase